MKNKTMLKYEIKIHNGPGRLIQYLKVRNNSKIFSPDLVSHKTIPNLHNQPEIIITGKINEKTDFSSLTLGYLPDLHHFSGIQSGNEFLSVFQEEYLPYIRENDLDFIAFPFDRAYQYRLINQYNSFILRVTNEFPDLSWAVPVTINNLENKLPFSPDFLILGDFSQESDFPRTLWNYIYKIKQLYPESIIYVPGVHPHFIPLLAYLGADLFDTLFAEQLALKNFYLTPFGEVENKEDTNNFLLSCSCSVCQRNINNETLSIDDLKYHNTTYVKTLIKTTRLAMAKNNLRDFIKQICKIHTSINGLYRLANQNQEYLLNYVDIDSSYQLSITDESDYSRPEILCYQNRLKTRYTIPDYNQFVLVIPCSAKKPYSNSNSHRKIHGAIKSTLGSYQYQFTEWIVTSPLGCVPRFWEDVFPVNSYDITVTGDWTSYEVVMLEEIFREMFNKILDSIPIIVYCPEPERTLLKNISEKFSRKMQFIDFSGRVSSNENLKLLEHHLRDIKNELSFNRTITKQKWLLDKFRSIADYQFGVKIGEKLFPENTRIGFRSFNEYAEYHKQQLATLSKQSGLLSLSIAGAINIKDHVEGLKVIFDGDELKGSAIYCSGISHASENIRPGDEVFVYNNTGDFIGIGKTQLTGSELETFKYGLGVSLRKKVKKS
ncbi:MAG: DUF5591 domain-containing protein [Candidatus Thorarchaeota archaeon]